MNKPDIIRNLELFFVNDRKTLPKFAKWLGLIDSTEKYEKLKHTIQVKVVGWIIDYVVIRSFIISFCLICLSAGTGLFLSSPTLFLLAEGISTLSYLVVDFKKELKGERK